MNEVKEIIESNNTKQWLGNTPGPVSTLERMTKDNRGKGCLGPFPEVKIPSLSYGVFLFVH